MQMVVMVELKRTPKPAPLSGRRPPGKFILGELLLGAGAAAVVLFLYSPSSSSDFSRE